MENQNLPALSNTPVVFNFFDENHFAVMQRVCTMFSASELVPDMYRVSDKNPKDKAIANCMIAVETAQRIGASPLMVMQNMDVIYGRPSWRAKFLIATVNSCGRFEPLEYRMTNLGPVGKIKIIEYVWNGQRKAPTEVDFDGTTIDNWECIAFTKPKGEGKSVLESSPVSVKLAIQEGWWSKAGSKWPTMTKKMLINRSASFWTNEYAPELSMGMHTAEEISDITDISFEDVTDKNVATKVATNGNKTTVSMATPAPGESSSAAEPSAENKTPAESEQTEKEEVKTNEETNPI